MTQEGSLECSGRLSSSEEGVLQAAAPGLPMLCRVRAGVSLERKRRPLSWFSFCSIGDEQALGRRLRLAQDIGERKAAEELVGWSSGSRSDTGQRASSSLE